jgi:hypothetical protein
MAFREEAWTEGNGDAGGSLELPQGFLQREVANLEIRSGLQDRVGTRRSGPGGDYALGLSSILGRQERPWESQYRRSQEGRYDEVQRAHGILQHE